MKADPRGMPAMLRSLARTAFLACLLPLAAATQQGAQITPNYKDADLGQVIEAVSQVTGKSFIVDPRVRAQVTCCRPRP
jgi:general secretion pathway protein D